MGIKTQIKQTLLFWVLFLFLFLNGCGGGDSSLESTVTVKITVANLPAQLELNKSTTEENMVEYWWSVTFDTNNDNVISAGDMGLGLIHHKKPGSQPITSSPSDIEPRRLSENRSRNEGNPF